MTVRRALGVGLAAVLVALLIGDYYAVRSCRDDLFAVFQQSVLSAPILAVASVWLLRFRPKGIWIATLILAPCVAFLAAWFAGITGEVAGSCGRL